MLELHDLTYRVGARKLLDTARAFIPAGARVGLVGRNGAESPHCSASYRRVRPSMAKCAAPRCAHRPFAQEAPTAPMPAGCGACRRLERMGLLARRKRRTIRSNRRDPDRLADISAYSAPARAAQILYGPWFFHCRSATSLRAILRRLAHARGACRNTVTSPTCCCWMSQPIISILKATLWLEHHLARYPQTMMVISHERDLLDVAVSWILHLEGGKLALYRGGYSAFMRQRSERLALNRERAKNQENERQRLQAFVDRFRATASKARQAQSRLKPLARLDPVIAIDAEEAVRPIEIPTPAKRLSSPIIALDDVCVGYEPGRPVLRGLTLRIDNDERIAILGANGNGKSTLVKLLAGRLPPMSGQMTSAQRLEVAYFAQHQLDELNEDESAYTHLRRLLAGATKAGIRTRAAAIGFPDRLADTPAKELSGGEKARLLLGLATLCGPHLVILDEPTNHLDIDRRAALLAAINAYPGAVILVAHDRHLLDACADRLLLCCGWAGCSFRWRPRRLPRFCPGAAKS